MAVKHIAFTAYPVTDMKRARDFYEGALGLTLTHDYMGKYVEYHLDNGCFTISDSLPSKPSPDRGGSIAFEVDDLDRTLSALKSKGVKTGGEPIVTPVCRMAFVFDPDGNPVVLHQKSPGR